MDAKVSYYSFGLMVNLSNRACRWLYLPLSAKNRDFLPAFMLYFCRYRQMLMQA
jgi:hypothetical protein